MTDFEAELRRRLADAAEKAPRFEESAIRADPGDVRRRFRLIMAVAAAVAVLVVGGGIAWLATSTTTGGPNGTSGGAASCARVLNFDGRWYDPDDKIVRLPKPGRNLGKASSCSDTVVNGTPSPRDQTTAYAIPSVSPDRAFLADDGVWVYNGRKATPKSIAALQRPIVCMADHPKTITGSIAAFDGHTDTSEQINGVPYRLTVRVDETGMLRSLDLGQFATVWITIKINRGTDGRAALNHRNVDSLEGQRLDASVRCQHERFMATSVKIN